MYGAENINYRLAKQDCYCRGCDKLLEKGKDHVISFHSYRNNGQYIKLCKECVEIMSNLIK